MTSSLRCAECQCIQQDCNKIDVQSCVLCTKDVCCCSSIHKRNNASLKKQPLVMGKIITIQEPDDYCCVSGSCENNKNNNNANDALKRNLATTSSPSSSGFSQFLRNIKGLYAAALGIEILCIAAAEIGENTGLYLFGFNLIEIPIAYAIGYALAGFTTFAAILGRYYYASSTNNKIDSCCSVLEQGAGSGFIVNLKITFKNFVIGITKLPQLHKQPLVQSVILKFSSIPILHY